MDLCELNTSDRRCFVEREAFIFLSSVGCYKMDVVFDVFSSNSYNIGCTVT